VITFDAGQTLIELDLDFLARRLAERGAEVAPGALGAAATAAWDRYDELVRAGADHPWHALMQALLRGAGIPEPDALVEWLWHEQPRANLWRRPIPRMLALARELAAGGAKVAVLSNSEGRLAELLHEIEIADPFAAIVDSGRVGIAKPDRRIFEHTLDLLDARGAAPVHIGDSWAADIAGALGAGWRAIWFGRHATPVPDPRVAVARDADAVRAALASFGVM
jgi:putative hydrolase of the HAD superfamily